MHILPYHDAARGKYRMRGSAFELEGTAAPSPELLARAVAAFGSRGVKATIGG